MPLPFNLQQSALSHIDAAALRDKGVDVFYHRHSRRISGVPITVLIDTVEFEQPVPMRNGVYPMPGEEFAVRGFGENRLGPGSAGAGAHPNQIQRGA